MDVKRTAVRMACLATLLAGSAGAGLAGPVIAAVPTAGKCIALTFDDGPHVSFTPRLLDVLRSQRAKATFFVVGSRAQKWPNVVRRASREGHEIGNHTWNHAVLPQLSAKAAQQQFSSTDAAVARATGRTPRVLRAPYGSLSDRIAAVDQRPFIGWNVDSLDWRSGGSQTIANRVLSRARSGSIVLMHDINARTVAAMPAIIKGLGQRGFQFATVSELLGGRCGGSRVTSVAGARGDRSSGFRASQSARIASAARTASAARIASAARTASTVAQEAEPGRRVSKTSPSGRTYSYQEGSPVGTYTINGRTFTYERD